MKFSTIALGLMLTVTVFAQKPSTSETGKTPSDSQSNPSSAGKRSNASELKTQTFKGTLVDTACGGSASADSAGANREASSGAGAPASKNDSAKGSANRSAAAGSTCSISSSSGEFALRTNDGRTLRFDAVGNERAKQELLNRKSWTNASAAGKSIQATVSGAETGDSLLVLSVH